MIRLPKHIPPSVIRKRLLLFLLVLAIFIIGVIVFRFVRQNNRLASYYTNETALLQLKEANNDLNLYLETAELAVHNYVESGKTLFLQNMDTAVQTIHTQFKQVQQTRLQVEQNSGSEERLLSDKLVLKKIVFIDKLKTLCDHHNRQAAGALLLSSEHIQLADSFARNKQMVDYSLQESIRKNKNEFENIRNRGNLSDYFAMGIAILLLILIFYFLRSENRKTARKGEELQIQKEHLKVILNSISEGLITTDRHGKIVFMNSSAERLTQWSLEEAAGRPLERIYHVVNEETGACFVNVVNRILEQKKPIELENNTLLFTKQGNSLVISNSGAPLTDKKGTISGSVLVFNDITLKKETENRLRKSEAFNRGILDALRSQIAVIDTAGNILMTNHAWNDFGTQNGTGTTSFFEEGANYFDVCGNMHAETDNTRQLAMEGIRQVISGKTKEYYLEYPRMIAGEEKWFYMRVTPFVSTDTLIIIEHHDITERKTAERKKQRAIDLYTIIAQGTSDTIWDWDIINNRIHYNYGINQMFGYEIEQVQNLSDWWKQQIHPDDQERVKEIINESFGKKTSQVHLDYRFRCSNGSYKYILDRAFVIFDASGNPSRMIGAMQDISYRKEEENRISKEIIQAQEAERQHIGSELHDNVNQILASSLMMLDMAKQKLDEREKTNMLLDKTRGHIDLAIAEIRKLSHELAPDIFEDLSFKESIEKLLSNINLDNQFITHLYFDGFTETLLSSEIRKNLYRILQEQLKNILKYSLATKIEVMVTCENNTIHMRIYDNGKGFNLLGNAKHMGIGLKNIKRRTELLNGEYHIISAHGKGCEINIRIPVEKAA